MQTWADAVSPLNAPTLALALASSLLMRSLPFYSCAKVSTFDIIAVASDDSESAYTSFKALRVLRALRLIKLVRLVRASRIIKRWETHFAINYTWLSIMQSGMSCILCAHWMACVWVLQASLAEDVTTTWLYGIGYAKRLGCCAKAYTQPAPTQSLTLLCACGMPGPNSLREHALTVRAQVARAHP